MRTNQAAGRRCNRGRAAALSGVVAALCLWATPAWAHVTAEPAEQLPGRIGTVGLRVPHGCGTSPTTAIDVAIPDGVEDVEPHPHEGWSVSSTKDPGGERVTGVRWTGGPLPSEDVAVFTLKARLPHRPGTRVWFKTLQTCELGETRWIQMPGSGERVDDLAHPAAWVDLVAPGTSRAERQVTTGTMLPLASIGGASVVAAGLFALARSRRRRA